MISVERACRRSSLLAGVHRASFILVSYLDPCWYGLAGIAPYWQTSFLLVSYLDPCWLRLAEEAPH
jgi:hypothetical protein